MEYAPFNMKREKFQELYKDEYEKNQEINRIYESLQNPEDKKKFRDENLSEFMRYVKQKLNYIYSNVNPDEKIIWKNFIVLIHRQYKPKRNLIETAKFLREVMCVTQDMINKGVSFSENDFLNKNQFEMLRIFKHI
jgi:hypothetical protein